MGQSLGIESPALPRNSDCHHHANTAGLFLCSKAHLELLWTWSIRRSDDGDEHRPSGAPRSSSSFPRSSSSGSPSIRSRSAIGRTAVCSLLYTHTLPRRRRHIRITTQPVGHPETRYRKSAKRPNHAERAITIPRLSTSSPVAATPFGFQSFNFSNAKPLWKSLFGPLIRLE